MVLNSDIVDESRKTSTPYEDYRTNFKNMSKQYPCLSAEEEKELAKKISAGDKRAKEILILSNIRLVIRMARKYSHREGVSLSDLIQDGIIGLLRASEKFDWKRGNRFSTYACWWIQQAILQSFAEHDRMIRLPGHIISNLSKVKRLQSQFEEQHNRQASIEELAQLSGISPKRLKTILFFTQKTVSLQTPIQNNDDHAQILEETIESEDCSPEEALEHSEIWKTLRRSFKTDLNDRERDILNKRYLKPKEVDLNDKKWTLEELGTIYGITRESVRQSEQRALRKIKTALGV